MSKTQDLALESLRDKWYGLNSDKYDEWFTDCAFCDHAKLIAEKDEYDLYLKHCNYCLIEEEPICKAISSLQDTDDPSLIIKALEELAKYGDLSSETAGRLQEYV